MKYWMTVMSLLLALFSGGAWARADVPIINHENVAITTLSGKTLESSQIQQAIGAACAANGWTMAPSGDNKLTASLLVRGKHTAIVDIIWTTGAYSIRYKSSVNLNYMEKDGVPMIHPFYNKWVSALRDSISRELAKQ